MPGNLGITFQRPEALILLLLLVPLVVYLTRTSQALLRRGRRRFSLALRIVLVTLLVLALAGAQWVTANDRLSVVFLLDRSDSISTAARAAQDNYVRRAISQMGANDSAGVIEFGADSLVDRPVGPEKSPPDLASKPNPSYTDLAGAIRLGLAVAPAETERRLVLVSDGQENTGSAEWAARLAAANDLPLDVVPLPTNHSPEVWVEGLQVPETLRENERPALNIDIRATSDTTTTLEIYADNSLMTRQEARLVSGVNNFTQTLPSLPRGFHTLGVRVLPASGADTRKENNSYSAYTVVLGKPKVLVVERQPGESAALVLALGRSIDADVAQPAQMPADLKSLAGYEGVVLVNVPASSLTSTSMNNLQVAVRDLGKGLVVVGGDESYAAGGYFRTPLEQMLPVDLNLPSKLDIPTVAMILVIDRSGSMGESHTVNGTGVTKLELAKEAAYRAVAQLSANDYVGVITFDDASNWAVNMQKLGDPLQFKDRIGGITIGGGTNIYSGLSPAVDALIASNAKSKHIVLLTDGVSEGGDYEGLLKKMDASQITLSTVAIGTDADQGFLQQLAQRGKGRYYYTEQGDALPEIFAHESHLAARSYLIEHDFTPARTSPSQILEGIGGLPVLHGYIGTSQKPGGQIVLVSDAGDPLLAQWQYGLGRVVAWTSDAKGQWAKDWVGWQQFPQFWAQAVRWSTGTEAGSTLQPRVEVDAGTARLTVEAATPDGSFLNGLAATASIVAPDLTTTTLQLPQVAAGIYAATFPVPNEGVYLIRTEASGSQVGSVSRTFGVVIPYSPEYRGTAGDDTLLPRLAQNTGGRVLSMADPAQPFVHNLAPVSNASPLWPLLVLIAVLLLPVDIGVRRIAIFRSDVARLLASVRQRLPARLRPAGATAHGASQNIAALARAKKRADVSLERARNTISRSPGADLTGQFEHPPVNSDLAARPSPAQDLQITGRTGRGEQAAPEAQAQPDTEQDEDSLASRLRRAREQRR